MLLVFRPERLKVKALAIADDDANQINEVLIQSAFDIRVDADHRSRKCGLAEHVNRLVANGQRMERMITHPERLIRSLATSAGSKCMSKLGQRKQTLPTVSLDGFLAKAAQQTQIVFPNGLS